MTYIIVFEEMDSPDLIKDIVKFITDKGRSHPVGKILEVDIDHSFISFPGLCIDINKCVTFRNNVAISMSHHEFSILVFLARHPERVYTKEQIYHAAYDEEMTVNINNAVYCLIRSLRKKLKCDTDSHDYIQTVRGIGYKFVAPER